jgi:hypothetical protein
VEGLELLIRRNDDRIAWKLPPQIVQNPRNLALRIEPNEIYLLEFSDSISHLLQR